MSADNAGFVLLEIPGHAADHLYREGSAKASFWEVLFGSSLGGRRRTHVSARPDGARVFDIPTAPIEDALLKSAVRWSAAGLPETTSMLHALDTKTLGIRLIGEQAQGSAVALFTLHVVSTSRMTDPRLAKVIARWFDEEGAVLANEILIPFGFTPAATQEGSSR